MSGDLFLPPDPKVEEPYRFTPQLAIRIGIIGIVAVGLFAVLFFRLWALQVISGKEYLQTARDNQVRTMRIQAPRGPILDANGKPLVTNVAGTVVQLWPARVPKGRLQSVVHRLSMLLDVPAKEIRKGIGEHRNDPLTPVTVKQAVHDDKANYLLEHKLGFPGVEVATTQLRRYDDGSLAAQLLGYVGEISPDELKALSSKGYQGGDRIGKTGVEAAYDRYLRGEAGVGEVRVNAQGDQTSQQKVSELPKAGYAVRLTLDAGLQRTAENAIKYGIHLARANGHWAADGGAIVAMDPNTGAIKALASYPTYDPAIFGRGDMKKIRALASPAANSPAIDRATYGTYPPGSTFKPVTALAALSEGLLTPDQYLQCQPELDIKGQKFVNWDPFVNVAMQLPIALAASCDTWFDELGYQFYFQKGSPMQDWAKKFGFEQKTGIDVGPEAIGRVPTPSWRKHYFKTAIDKLWKPGDSVQLAIGQGDLLVTPLQMARFYALIANGGKLVYPHVVEDVEQPAGQGGEPPVRLRTFAAKPPRDVDLSPSALEIVQQGLYEATHNSRWGTSYHVFGHYPIPIAGKTGTAEKFVTLPVGYQGLKKPFAHMQDQSWWCGYGPVPIDEHSLVVCALIENGGHGGEAAAPAALKVFERFFGQNGPPPTVGNSD